MRREDPALARLPARRHGLERLHPGARAGVDAGRARGRRSSARSPSRSSTTSAARGPCGRTSAGCCRSSCSTATRATRSSSSRTARGPSSTRWVERNAAALREHAAGRPRLREPRPARRPGRRRERRAVRGQGARLGARVLDARQRGAVGVGAGGARRGPRPSSSAPPTSARCWRTSSATSTASTRCRRASTSTSGARGRARRRSPACSRRRGATRRTRGTRTSGCRTRATPSASPRSSRATSRRSSTSGSSSTTRASTSCSRRCSEVDARAVIVGFGDYRETLEAAAGPRTLFTGPLEHRHLVHLLALADATVVPSIFPEAFGMVAAEAAAAGSPPLVARHSGLAEIADGLEQEYPPHLRHLASFATGDAAELAAKLSELLALPGAGPGGRARGRPERDREPLELGGRRTPLAGAVQLPSRRWVTSNGLATPSSSTLRARGSRAGPTSRSPSRRSSRCSIPATLGLVNRFEDVQAAAQGTPLEPHLVGELIASEVEIKTGRCESFAEIPAAMTERRAQLRRARRHARDRARRDRNAPLGRLEGPADHRHAALPPERRAAPLRRLAQQHLRPPRPHRHPRRRPRDRGHERPPQLPARDPRALRQLAVRRERQHRAALGADADLHALLPPLRRAGRLRRPGSSTRTTSASSTRPARSPSTRSSGGASARTSASRRSRSGSATASPTSPRRSRSRPSAPRSPPGSPARTTRASRSPDQPHRLIEENVWRAIRYGLSGELIDLERGDVLPARARLERLLEWVAPVAEEIGAAPVPRHPRAQRRRAADRPLRGGGDPRGDLRRAGRRPRPWLTTSSASRTSSRR